LDLDSCLNNLDEVWISKYNEDYRDNLTREDIVRWETHTIVKPECGHKIYDYLLLPNFFRDLEIKPHAKEVTEWLQQYLDIYIVTAYYPSTCPDKCDWIKHHLPHINQKNIIFCNNKGLLKAQYIVDDGGHNILDFHKTNPCGLPIIFDAPWNKDLKNKFIRVKNWLEIQEVFEDIFKQNTLEYC
jgi:5'(3')-deoxyribonucleotidase